MGKDKTVKNGDRLGLSLKKLQIVMIFVTAVVSIALLYYTFLSYRNYRVLSAASEGFADLHTKAEGLKEASDYLTVMVLRFTDNGELQYLNDYFEEVNVTKRRDKALAEIAKYPECAGALEKFQQAMNGSNRLMETEFYVLKLVIDANGYTDIPEELRKIRLKEEDADLPKEEKMALARKMLFEENYYSLKGIIIENMDEGQAEIDRLAEISKDYLENRYQHNTRITRTLIIAQVIIYLIVMIITMHLGITPILKAVKNIQENRKIDDLGSMEFRFLAKAYNKMYEDNQASINQLNYKATHDELTGVYNRAGYYKILPEIDVKNTCFIIVDVDNFKKFNDTMGHEVGDLVLKRVAVTLEKTFKPTDHVCRIGGDEFAIILKNIERSRMPFITEKLDSLKEELSKPGEKEPPITLSIGISHGYYAESTDELFEQADKALYVTKEKGKNGYSVYK
ncbi:MAG: GGDEF domain-containing protein [Lachnospiraceae bacterium]|nr:GGDEF domain-containing protein [Lachnospiraceae bacterium]